MKKVACLILSFIIVLSMCACNVGQKDEPNTQTTQPTSTDTSSDSTDPSISIVDLPTPEVDYNASKMDLTAYIIDSAYKTTGQNTMFSPLSLDMALGMVAEGAGSEYHSIFPKLLGKENYSQFANDYAEYLGKLNIESNYEYDKYKTVFEIANSIWVDDRYDVLESYKEKVKNFNLELKALDFSHLQDVVSKINAWCKEKTHDMIDKVVKEDSFNKDSVAVVVNAVYFESPWLEAWSVLGEKEKFAKLDGAEAEVKMIGTTTGTYYENDFATAFGCQYRNGLTFIGILPKEEGDFLIQDFDLETLISSKTYEYDVNVKMPAFKFDNRIDNLVEILTDSGYGILFDKDVGMFNQMLTDGEENLSMAISNIIQMDAIELDENGTKAAAVTAIVMDNCTGIIEPKQTKDVELDRPFAFVIHDSEMDQIVFVGKVVNP